MQYKYWYGTVHKRRPILQPVKFEIHIVFVSCKKVGNTVFLFHWMGESILFIAFHYTKWWEECGSVWFIIDAIYSYIDLHLLLPIKFSEWHKAIKIVIQHSPEINEELLHWQDNFHIRMRLKWCFIERLRYWFFLIRKLKVARHLYSLLANRKLLNSWNSNLFKWIPRFTMHTRCVDFIVFFFLLYYCDTKSCTQVSFTLES